MKRGYILTTLSFNRTSPNQSHHDTNFQLFSKISFVCLSWKTFTIRSLSNNSLFKRFSNFTSNITGVYNIVWLSHLWQTHWVLDITGHTNILIPLKYNLKEPCRASQNSCRSCCHQVLAVIPWLEFEFPTVNTKHRSSPISISMQKSAG